MQITPDFFPLPAHVHYGTFLAQLNDKESLTDYLGILDELRDDYAGLQFLLSYKRIKNVTAPNVYKTLHYTVQQLDIYIREVVEKINSLK